MIDTLSDVLRSVQLAGAVFFTSDASAPWSADEHLGSAAGPRAMPGVEHVIEYHVVTAGACWGGLPGERSIRLEAGDVLVFPHGDAQISLQRGDHDDTQVICGFLGCNARPFSPLLATLPRVMHLPGAGQPDSVRRRLVELAVAESAGNEAGSDCMLARLGELLFAEVVRQHLAVLPQENVGWFAGLRDPGIGRALQKLHERPAHPWSLEELAKGAGMSRSTLAERFAYFVGIPPIQYLAQWRIQLAASLLRSSKSSLAEIADRVGYGSEAALSRAFKRRLGVSPTPYRRGDHVWQDAS
jgi:AraC-like DNA-binding protein